MLASLASAQACWASGSDQRTGIQSDKISVTEPVVKEDQTECPACQLPAVIQARPRNMGGPVIMGMGFGGIAPGGKWGGGFAGLGMGTMKLKDPRRPEIIKRERELKENLDKLGEKLVDLNEQRISLERIFGTVYKLGDSAFYAEKGRELNELYMRISSLERRKVKLEDQLSAFQSMHPGPVAHKLAERIRNFANTETFDKLPKAFQGAAEKLLKRVDPLLGKPDVYEYEGSGYPYGESVVQGAF